MIAALVSLLFVVGASGAFWAAGSRWGEQRAHPGFWVGLWFALTVAALAVPLPALADPVELCSGTFSPGEPLTVSCEGWDTADIYVFGADEEWRYHASLGPSDPPGDCPADIDGVATQYCTYSASGEGDPETPDVSEAVAWYVGAGFVCVALGYCFGLGSLAIVKVLEQST